MKTIFYMLIVLFYTGCQSQLNSFNNSSIVNEFDSLNINIIPDFIETYFPKNWYELNSEQILKDNPNFDLNNIDSIKYLIIPSLIVPIEKIGKNNIDILSYLEKGNLSIKSGVIYLIENDSLIGKILIDKGFYPLDFDEKLKQKNIDIFNTAEHFFELNIKTKTGFSTLPGIIFFKDNKYQFITVENNIYPLEDMVEVSFKSKNGFRKSINAKIERNKK